MLLGNALVIDKNTIFRNLRNDRMNFDQLYEEIINFIKADTNSSYKISVGTDSQVADKTVFVSCILVHRVGKGATGFLHKCEIQRPVRNLREKIYLETCASLQLAYLFDEEKIEHIKSLATKKGVKLILSYHNFVETPSEEFMMRKIKEEITYGADIPKIAVMPKEQGDVLKLLSVTYNARKKISNPLITVSMGSLGFISRFVGCIFGSDMTFASGVNESAPGQMPIEEMRRFIEIII
mgnify:CR=1 FL=1